jgi:hypothetical protein
MGSLGFMGSLGRARRAKRRLGAAARTKERLGAAAAMQDRMRPGARADQPPWAGSRTEDAVGATARTEYWLGAAVGTQDRLGAAARAGEPLRAGPGTQDRLGAAPARPVSAGAISTGPVAGSAVSGKPGGCRTGGALRPTVVQVPGAVGAFQRRPRRLTARIRGRAASCALVIHNVEGSVPLSSGRVDAELSRPANSRVVQWRRAVTSSRGGSMATSLWHRCERRSMLHWRHARRACTRCAFRTRGSRGVVAPAERLRAAVTRRCGRRDHDTYAKA